MLWIPHVEYVALRQHGEAAYPHESCGVLLGSPRGHDRLVQRAVPCRNARTDSPENRYQVDPLDLLRLAREAQTRGEEVVGFYHSHPDHAARWSATDLAEAHWLGCSYLITRIADGRAEETCSFLLEGYGEDDKRFSEEDLGVLDAAAEASDLYDVEVTSP